ncbi:hypothetical protein GF318_00250 [Candidatus Micrarchaeota archaeon]|nr:hypothetical protein [Candidatus Micrarchaeota archaeon]
MMKDIWVVKENGEQEKFSPRKVKRALRRSGLGVKTSQEMLKVLEPKLYNGITTKKIYQIVYRLVKERKPEVTHKYNLKRALQDLGPAGYHFEDFVAKLLDSRGYKTEVRQHIGGRCTSHEIDAVATKGKDKYMVECKFHNEPGTRCRIQSILYVYSRFLDLEKSVPRKFTKPWLITNTKFSTDVVTYAECMDLPLLGWHYPFKQSLEVLIDRTKCYPVTVIDMSRNSLKNLLKRRMVTVQDIPESPHRLSDFTGVSLGTAKKIVKKAEYAR